MITKKMKIAVCLLSLTALLSINNVNAGIFRAGSRLIFSKPATFVAGGVAGVLAYPWLHKYCLHKYFFISPEQRASLEQQAQQGEATQANPDGEQNRTQTWTGKLVQVAGSIRDNSVFYWQYCKKQVNNLWNRSKLQEELMLKETNLPTDEQREENAAGIQQEGTQQEEDGITEVVKQ
ncbi:hypothetical protein E3J79_03795 [Candidatus Dependentiae bacterium]|nr:MAG: hypothetical protein E3J79_03795 [Candidatus Dependentiae bacterium]